MTDARLEFVIVGVVAGEANRLTVIGRNGDLPIPLGQTFEALFRYKPRKYPDQLGDVPVREVEKALSLRVVCIRAYERPMETLGEGMTGSLGLEGEGLRWLAPGWVLGKRASAPLRTDLGPCPSKSILSGRPG